MVKKCKAVKLTKFGVLTDEKGEAVICPIRAANCTVKCAWFSFEDRVFRCKDAVIGALRPDSIRSFRLRTGPDVYDLEELLVSYEVNGEVNGEDVSLAKETATTGP